MYTPKRSNFKEKGKNVQSFGSPFMEETYSKISTKGYVFILIYQYNKKCI